jgi:CBS domain-containing protein
MTRPVRSETVVGDVATPNPICIDRAATILAASALMRVYQVEHLVVADECNGKLMPGGILSARDIVTRIVATQLDPTVLTVGDMMWSRPTPARAADSAMETLKLLDATKSNALPVVDGDGGLAGVVSRGDLLWALARDSAPAPEIPR